MWTDWKVSRLVLGALFTQTSSGKSSLVLLLLRFLNADVSTPKNVAIDGLPLHLIHRPTLRSRIIAIPQHPFLLPGGNTFRENIACTLAHNASTKEEDYEYALKAVRLWDLVVEQGGLDGELKEGSLSHGQKQLFCLARAVVRARVRSQRLPRTGGILLLDEVNSSVDKETDAFMQDVVKNEFKGYTVICVAHRLQSVRDYDRIVVMDKGEIVEIGEPGELLAREGGRFQELWRIGRGEGSG